jgi:threonine synthase
MKYISTRGGAKPSSFTDILLSGLAPDGGLFVPERWASLDLPSLAGKGYTDIAEAVIYPSVEGDISRSDLRTLLDDTYTPEIFGSPEITPLRQLADDFYLLDLFNGPTLAFKDVALQFLGRLFDHVLEKSGQHLTIVGATSGDTGSAAIEACRGRKNITVHILHPHNRTSAVQRKQMTTVLDDNIHNIALEGTFDDCQSIVKQAFADPALRERNIAAINSINWARIIAQSVYYVATCLRLGATKDSSVDFAVPTGNFGNVYAGYVAQNMEAPVGHLVIGSNRNDILTRFFESGSMNSETVVPSLSPSMDIQVSSNFERYLFDLMGRDPAQVSATMADFAKTGTYKIAGALHEKAKRQFSAYRCTDDQTLAVIRDVFEKTGELIDPHTAVGVHAARQYRAESGGRARPLVALACAHPAKFPDAVAKATGQTPPLPAHLADLMQRPERLTVLPNDFARVKAHILGCP